MARQHCVLYISLLSKLYCNAICECISSSPHSFCQDLPYIVAVLLGGMIYSSLKQQVFIWFYSFYQWTPLHVGAEEGRYDAVKKLVDKGAKINIKDKKGVSM